MSSHAKNHWPRPLRIIYRHRMRFVLSTLGVAMGVWAIAAVLPRSFEVRSQFRRSSVATLTPTNRNATDASRMPMRQTLETDLIGGPLALEAVVDDPALPFFVTFARTSEGELTATGRKQRQHMIDNLAQNITVDTEVAAASMELVTITVSRSSTAEEAVGLANGLVDRYLVESRQRFNVQTEEAADFLDQQIDQQHQKIAGLRQTKIQLEHDHPTLRSDEAAASRERLIATRAELRSINQQSMRLNQEHKALSQWASAQPQHLEQRTRGRNPKIAHLNAQKARLEQDLSEHRYRWGRTDDHPLVQKTLTKIESLDRKLASTPKVIDLVAQRQTNAAKLEAEAKLKSLAAIRQALVAQRDALESEAGQLEAIQQAGFADRSAYDKIAQTLAESHRELEFWQTRQRDDLLESSINPKLNFSVIQRASPANVIVFPRREIVDALALLLGFTAGIVAVVLGHRRHCGYDTLQAVEEELDLPIFGAVVEIHPQENLESPSQASPFREAA